MQKSVKALIARRERSVPTLTGSTFSDLAPDIQRQMYSRLGGAGILYAFAWLANFAYYRMTASALGSHDRQVFWYTISTVCVCLGVAVYLLCRKQRIAPRSFLTFAMAFEVLAAVGIMAGYFGWEHSGALILERIGQTFGIAPGDVLSGVVEPLNRNGLRLLYVEGVTWVSVWLLMFPLIVPSSMLRTVLSTLLTAATVPAMMAASLLVNGIPETIKSWILPYMMDATVPTFICAGIAIFGSRVVYRLTRDLSKAKEMGSYQLVERIGMGGMGEVWSAKHHLLARPAAIKLIRADAISGNPDEARTAMRRFELEAQATSGLTSPHSIDLYDFGITDDGTFYYVMELLDGIDLKTLVERHGPIPAERTIHVLRQACHSLLDAHMQGIVHRDVKPGNLLVCRYGPDFDFVKVLDFGLVKHVGDADSKGTQITREGTTSGTPAFMAPEMAIDNRRTDPRADLYALGCVGYWLLTGHLVFDAESPLAVLVQHAKDEPVPPSARTELEIPADLEALILRTLSKNPVERPQTARELAERLDECAKGLPAWTEDRAALWWRTHLPQLTTPADATADRSAEPTTRIS